MAPPKSKTNTPEPTSAGPQTSMRVTRSASRQANSGASRSVSRAPSDPETPARNPSGNREDTPRLRPRGSKTYGSNEEVDIAVQKLLGNGDSTDIDSVTSAINKAISRVSRATDQDNTRNSSSQHDTRSSSQVPSEAESEHPTTTTTRGNARRRRTRQSLNTIDESSELNSSNSIDPQQDTSLISGVTGLNTPYGEPATSSELNSALESKQPTPPSRRRSQRTQIMNEAQNDNQPDYASHWPSVAYAYNSRSLTLLALIALLPFALVLLNAVFNSIASSNFDLGRSVQSIAPSFSYSNSHIVGLEQRVENLEGKVDQLFELLSTLAKNVQSIQSELPDHLVVPVVDGKWTIPEGFWHALKARLTDEQNARSESSWTHFFRSQKVKKSEYTRGPDYGDMDKAFTDWLSKHDLITRQQFMDLLDENVKQMNAELNEQEHVLSSKLDGYVKYIDSELYMQQHRLDNKLAAMQRSMSESVMEASSNLIRNSLAARPHWETAAHVAINLGHNALRAMNEINWFSTALGAVVDPFMSSPTAQPSMRWYQKAYFKYIRRAWTNPHSTALRHWDEPRECWCASSRNTETGSKNDPKAQIAVALPRPIYPRSVTVEHMLSGGTPDWQATPRDMELWVSIPDATKREWISRNTDAVFWDAEYARQGGGLKQHELDASYVRLHRWTYDAHGANHVQNFPLVVDMERWGTPTSKVVVRATSNYGGNFTCFYRLRLHGEEPAVAPDE